MLAKRGTLQRPEYTKYNNIPHQNLITIIYDYYDNITNTRSIQSDISAQSKVITYELLNS